MKQLHQKKTKMICLRQTLAVFLLLLLMDPLVRPAERPPDPRAQLTALPIGTKLDIRLKDGSRVQGQLRSVDPDRFTVAVGRVPAPTTRVIRFGELENVRAQPHTHTPVVAWIVTGALVAVVVIVVTAILVERHNEGA